VGGRHFGASGDGARCASPEGKGVGGTPPTPPGRRAAPPALPVPFRPVVIRGRRPAPAPSAGSGRGRCWATKREQRALLWNAGGPERSGSGARCASGEGGWGDTPRAPRQEGYAPCTPGSVEVGGGHARHFGRLNTRQMLGYEAGGEGASWNLGGPRRRPAGALAARARREGGWGDTPHAPRQEGCAPCTPGSVQAGGDPPPEAGPGTFGRLRTRPMLGYEAGAAGAFVGNLGGPRLTRAARCASGEGGGGGTPPHAPRQEASPLHSRFGEAGTLTAAEAGPCPFDRLSTRGQPWVGGGGSGLCLARPWPPIGPQSWG